MRLDKNKLAAIKPYECKHIRIMHRMGMSLTHWLKQKHVAAVIDSSNRIVNIGVNKVKSDPFQLVNSLSRKTLEHPEYQYTFPHAECSALKGLDKDMMKHCSIFVIRVDPETGNLMESKPCPGCMRLIKKMDIGRIIHSTKEGLLSEIIL